MRRALPEISAAVRAAVRADGVPRTEAEAEALGDQVVQILRRSVTDAGLVATGRLRDSIDSRVVPRRD